MRILFTIILLAASLTAQDNLTGLMSSGNEHYQNQRFAEAVDAYESILNNGYESEELYYNLGNAYFRLDDIGKAVLNYERALKLSPGFEDAEYNLKLANARTIDKIKEVPQLFFVNWWNMLLALFSVNGWMVVVILVYLLLLAAIALYFLTKSGRVQNLAFMGGTAALVVFLAVGILLLSKVSYESTTTEAVLLDEIAAVKISPNEESSDAFVIHEGVKFEIEETLTGWAKIKLADGKVGWLPQTTFATI